MLKSADFTRSVMGRVLSPGADRSWRYLAEPEMTRIGKSQIANSK
jgi:hypothetical protein